VTINLGDDTHTLKVSVRKKVRAEKQSDADSYNTKTKPEISVNDKIVTLNANTQGAGDKGVTTDMDVYVPRNLELVITSRRGDIAITGVTGNAAINHQHGEVSVSDHTGNVTIDMEGGSSRVSHVKGDVTIQGRGNEVAIEDVDGMAHLNGEFQESVRLVRISKTVSFKSARTDMEFARLDGRLDLDSGDLRADSMTGPVRLITRSKDISLDGLSGDLRLQDDNGTVEVGVHKAGNIQIENRKGDVQVTLAPNTAVRVEARSRGGEISSDFGELQITNGESQASATGSIGSNGPNLVINNEHGTVEIRKGNVAVTPPAPPDVPGPPGKPSKASKALPAPKAPPVETEN
jgi:putative adhesin